MNKTALLPMMRICVCTSEEKQKNRQIFASQPTLLSAVNKVHCGRQVGPILVNYLSEVPFPPRRLSCGHTVQPDPIQLPNGKVIYSRCSF